MNQFGRRCSSYNTTTTPITETAGQSPRSVTSCSKRVERCVAWSFPHLATLESTSRSVVGPPHEQGEHSDDHPADDQREHRDAQREPVATSGSIRERRQLSRVATCSALLSIASAAAVVAPRDGTIRLAPSVTRLPTTRATSSRRRKGNRHESVSAAGTWVETPHACPEHHIPALLGAAEARARPPRAR